MAYTFIAYMQGHRFISLNHTRALKGHESPAHYNHQSQKAITGFGNQILSQRASPASFGFSKAPKTTFKTSNTPGPGAPAFSACLAALAALHRLDDMMSHLLPAACRGVRLSLEL